MEMDCKKVAVNLDRHGLDDMILECTDLTRNQARQIPEQLNQNSSTTTCFPASSTLNYLHQNYMFQSILFHRPIKGENFIYKEIMQRKTRLGISDLKKKLKSSHFIDTRTEALSRTFDYDVKQITKSRQQLNLITNCNWLDFRLDIIEMMDEDDFCFEQVALQLRSSFIHTAIDLMIYYHTKSDFSLQLFMVESHNLLILLKHKELVTLVKSLPDGFSENLIKMIKDCQNIEENGNIKDESISNLTQSIMCNYTTIDTMSNYKKHTKRDSPKVIYYSFYAPSSMVMDGESINRILDKKILALQRRYYCKIIVNGPFLRNLSPSTRNEYYHFEIFFDYMVNYWSIVLREFIRWINSFTRNALECHIDQICVTYVNLNFFCCDEIKNLLKRQHLLREVDLNFIKLIEWIKLYQVDRMVI